MLTFEAGAAVTLPVTLINNGQPAVPDPGTAVLSVYAPDGTQLYTEGLTTGPTDHRLFVTIPAEHNTITTAFSRRKVVVTASRGGSPFSASTFYRLMPAMNFTVRPADVRNFLGVNDSELPDEDIDLAQSLLDLEFILGREPLAAALISGEESELRANEAILYHAALTIIPSLMNRVAQQDSDGSLTFRRHSRKDFSDLKRIAEGRLSAAVAVVSPQNDPGFSLLITTQDADPITG